MSPISNAHVDERERERESSTTNSYFHILQETIPADFHPKLDVYAQQGYRIIAIAYKMLSRKMTYAKIQRISREKIECDLTFLGFVILENRLKPDTLEIVNNLMAANIRTVMVTGDNILTALSVAHDCDMIPTGQNIIIVTAKPKPSHPNEYELIYNLSGMSGSNNPNTNGGALLGSASQPNAGGSVGNSISMNHLQQLHVAQLKSKPNGFVVNERDGNGVGASIKFGQIEANGTNYALLTTNSNSIASLETVDTCTQTTQITQRDIEMGDNKFSANNFQYHGNAPTDAYDDDDNSMKLVPELPNNNYRFAMTGKTWSVIRDYLPDELPKFVTRGTVFARMSPEQKQSLVLELQDLGYYVAMCGDGANDCGALKAAHTGISLSEAESSVASPFTSKNATIACVPNIIKEGRCVLVTSIAIFKYMAAYSLIQFASVLILYSIDSNLTDIEFLYIDLFMISIFAFFFGKTEAYVGPLVKQTPLNSLIAVSPIASLVIHLLLGVGFQVLSWFWLKQQEWYVPFEYTNDRKYEHACYENYTIFIVSCFQYIILAVVFSKGAPYRKSIFTNIGFIASLIVNTIVSIMLAVKPFTWTSDFFELMYPPDPMFRFTLVAFGVCNFVLSMCIEVFIIDNLLFRHLRYRFHNIEKSRRKFLSIENHLRQQPSWPPISQFGNDCGSGGGAGDSASTPVSAVATSPIDGSDVDQQSPKSFTEIRVEADCLTPFENCNSVLKGFFDNIPSDEESSGDSIDDSDDDVYTDARHEQTNSTGSLQVVDNNNHPNDSNQFEANHSTRPVSNETKHEKDINDKPNAFLSAAIANQELANDADATNSICHDHFDSDKLPIVNNVNSNNEYKINEIFATTHS